MNSKKLQKLKGLRWCIIRRCNWHRTETDWKWSLRTHCEEAAEGEKSEHRLSLPAILNWLLASLSSTFFSDAIGPHWFRQSLIHPGNEVWLQKEPPKKWISHRNLQKATTGRKNLIKYKGKIHCKKVKRELQDSETARWLLVYKTRQVWCSCCWLDSRLISSEVINILMHIWEGRFLFLNCFNH